VWVQLAHSQNFSEWTQASGVTQVEYRWKRNDVKGCDVEYRDQQERGRKKYKTRIVFQTDGDERKQTNAILSFNEGVANASDHVQTCNLITDVTVTRF
jgi:hypothetical protein